VLAEHAAGWAPGGYWLQVEERNTGARALYQRTGFTDHHGYHYRIAPAEPAGRAKAPPSGPARAS